MKRYSKLPRVSLYWGLSLKHPLLLLDAYRHSFTFVTIKDPRTESGVTIDISILKFQVSLAIYVDKPYQPKSEWAKKMRELRIKAQNVKKE